MIHIGILGSKGIPNHYGGFEEFAEQLSIGLVEKGFRVSVYCPHHHPYKSETFRNVQLIKCFDPELYIGPVGQFLYDFNCILDSRKRGFDVLYQLGYTSSGIWQWLFSRKSIVVTNMDGLEWQRKKYNTYVRTFLKLAEKLAVNKSSLLIADSPIILDYLKKKFQKPAIYIPYGAKQVEEIPSNPILPFDLLPFRYYLIIARIQADNHIEDIIRGVNLSKTKHPLVVVGSIRDRFSKRLLKSYANDQIRFVGGIYDLQALNLLRRNALLYFHGHSAGGTNPSLLQAMAAGSRICSHDNEFNRSILGEDAEYFRNTTDIEKLINEKNEKETVWVNRITKNHLKISETFQWPGIIEQYASLFQSLVSAEVNTM